MVQNITDLSSCQPSWKADAKFRDTFAPYTTKLKAPGNGSRETPALWNICEGCILWLPLEYDTRQVDEFSPPKKVLGHPVLVLHVSVSGPEDAVVTFAIMRSFQNGGPKTNHPLFWLSYLRITKATSQESRPKPYGASSSNSASFSDENVPYLEKESKNRGMKEISYIDVFAVYRADWQDLQCYAAGQRSDSFRHRLNEESFMKVLGRLKPEHRAYSRVWVPTNNLWETFKHKHISGAAEGRISGRTLEGDEPGKE